MMGDSGRPEILRKRVSGRINNMEMLKIPNF